MQRMGFWESLRLRIGLWLIRGPYCMVDMVLTMESGMTSTTHQVRWGGRRYRYATAVAHCGHMQEAVEARKDTIAVHALCHEVETQ